LRSLYCWSDALTSTTTYGPDGREAHALNCSGWARSWSMCAVKAGEICGGRGYEVIAAGGGTAGTIATVNPSGGFAGPSSNARC